MPKNNAIIHCSLLICCLGVCSGCLSPNQKAWNSYEKGMNLYFDGYEPTDNKEDKIEQAYLEALNHNPDIPAVHASLGVYLAKKGKVEQAMQHWQEEKKKHPEAGVAMDIVLKREETKEGVLGSQTEKSQAEEKQPEDESNRAEDTMCDTLKQNAVVITTEDQSETIDEVTGINKEDINDNIESDTNEA